MREMEGLNAFRKLLSDSVCEIDVSLSEKVMICGDVFASKSYESHLCDEHEKIEG